MQGSIFTAALEDEWHHAAGPQPTWQESVFLTFQDQAESAAGIVRIGNVPGRSRANACVAVTAGGSTYREQADDLVLAAAAPLHPTFEAAGASATFDDGTSEWRYSSRDADLRLTFKDAHPRAHLWKTLGHGALTKADEEFSANTLAVAGWATGELRLGSLTIEVAGTASRDHSWGPRNADVLTSWWWLTGLVDEATYFALGATIDRDGNHRSFGYLVLGGTCGRVRHSDIDLTVGLDGISVRGASTELVTDASGPVALSATAIADNLMLDLGGTYLESHVPVAVVLDGRPTTANLGVGLNPRAGTAEPACLLAATLDQGLTRSRR